MTIAEIHGKISGSGSNLSDRLEDLLTSDVFGPLRYLPFADGFQHIFREARLYSDPEKRLEVAKNTPEVCFWPKLPKSEPDVLIECGDHLLLVEAKYLSGKSGEFDEDDVETAKSDQLAREFSDLMTYCGAFSKRSLVYLTADRTMPKDSIVNSYNAVCEEHPDYAKKYQQNTYWLSWFEVRRVIENLSKKQSGEKRLIFEDIGLLLRKKRFRGFEGFCKQRVETSDAVVGFLFYEMKIGFGGLKFLKVNAAPEKVFYQKTT
ncbi:MAG: hypothetical protein MPK09_02945 [Gammaproteobacteria bacterium]|nr:hypothetical protein [Gammaproteobacteria bacterium]